MANIKIVSFTESTDFGEDLYVLDIDGVQWFYTVISGPDAMDYEWARLEEPHIRVDGGPFPWHVDEEISEEFTTQLEDVIGKFNEAYRVRAIEVHLDEIKQGIVDHAIDVANQV